jgi:hypothetical protein
MPKRTLRLLRKLFRKHAVEQALDDELRSSVEVLTEEKMKQGVSQSVARREALIEIGGIEQVKEGVRAVRAGRFVENLKTFAIACGSYAANPASSPWPFSHSPSASARQPGRYSPRLDWPIPEPLPGPNSSAQHRRERSEPSHTVGSLPAKKSGRLIQSIRNAFAHRGPWCVCRDRTWRTQRMPLWQKLRLDRHQ